MLDLQYPYVGNDPEILVMRRGNILPAELLFGGEKEFTPLVRRDNAAVEFNFPANPCIQTVNEQIGNCFTDFVSLLKEVGIRTHIDRVSFRPTEEVNPKDLDRFRSLTEFGCNPSLVCFAGDVNESRPRVNPRKILHRSVGYHIHLGSRLPEDFARSDARYRVANLLHSNDRIRLVQMCDLFVGLPAILMERDERVPLRRSTLGYGKAGEYREQPHGFEYRTLGSWPLVHPMWTWWANGAARDAFQIVYNNLDDQFLSKMDMQAVANAINTGDLHAALPLWAKVKAILKPIMDDKKFKDSVAIDDRHPILSEKMVRLFEFFVAKGGLKFTTPAGFHITAWVPAQRVGYFKPPIRYGFESSGEKLVKDPRIEPEYIAWCANWSMEKDNLSKVL